jgi:3-hydroxymyristoyl/3-hydroxydecanoyl-(acyl carrier protein) dehydratase
LVDGFLEGEGVRLSKDKIMAIQPNKPPFLFVDQAFCVVPQVQAGAIFEFPEDWSVFEHHFAGNPMVPASIVLEMIMQTGSLAFFCDILDRRDSDLIYLSRVAQFSISEKIRPREQIETRAVITFLKGDVGALTADVERVGRSEPIARCKCWFKLDFER